MNERTFRRTWFFCVCDITGLWLLVSGGHAEAEVKGSLTMFAWPLVSQKNLWEDASNSRAGGSMPSLSLSCSVFPPFSLPVIPSFSFSWSQNICLKIKMWKPLKGWDWDSWWPDTPLTLTYLKHSRRKSKGGWAVGWMQPHTCRLILAVTQVTVWRKHKQKLFQMSTLASSVFLSSCPL